MQSISCCDSLIATRIPTKKLPANDLYALTGTCSRELASRICNNVPGMKPEAASGPAEPKWLTGLREQVLSSGDWAEVAQLIQARVRAELGGQGLGNWADLSKEEKDVLLNEVSEEVRNHPAYQTFFNRLGSTVDDVLLQQEHLEHSEREDAEREEHLRIEADTRKKAARHGPFGGPMTDKHTTQMLHMSHLPPERQPNRHPDMPRLLDIAGEGASALLRRNPKNFHALRAICCRGLPKRLRLEVWRMQLRNLAARQEYIALAAEDRMSVFSKKDPDIAKSCRALLDAEFEDSSLGDVLLPCKSILSYIHRRHGGQIASPLRYIAVVLVWALYSAGERAVQFDTAELVEYMLALLEETRYRTFFDLHSFAVHQDKFGEHVSNVSVLLQQADPSFHRLLECLR